MGSRLFGEKYEREAKRYWDVFYKCHKDKTHEDFKESCVRAFVSDLTVDDLCKEILPSSVDIVTMIFMLSAVSPEKMPLVLQNVRKIIKPNGYVLFRDYATEDLAQERFSGKDQKFSDNFYVRGDGTRAYYFSNEFLTNLFRENGFVVDKHYKINIYLKEYFSEGFYCPQDFSFLSQDNHATLP
ncbi:methyltransferase-like protein 6 isoform X7 [Arachis ipaensis]|uniref:methyltransferase-like protein 6 isoform X7 n=1 Tax=Arachis ipaensis TaxID=130454 RepID=UPI000A2B3307|nr:methyltransferase-like protein 6 isoform X7 [Arachis ipaensis]